MTDHEFLKAVDEFKAANLTSASELCTIYHKVRKFLLIIISIFKLIPVWGATVAEGLTLLMGALDKLCPAAARA